MGWDYAFLKCADKSFKGIPQLEKLRALEDVFNLEKFLTAQDISPELSDSDEARERISRYTAVKEALLRQIIPFCICSEYYQQESNNNLSQYYFRHALEATDIALSSSKQELEKIFEQDQCEYDTVLAAALVIRYGIEKGFLTVK